MDSRTVPFHAAPLSGSQSTTAVGPGKTAEGLQERAMELLEHFEEQTSKAFCVASAGRAFADDHVTEANLFGTIEDILCDTSSRIGLRRVIKELAGLAEGVRHG
jgi:hypothetical protein